jgi:peptide/nickel transport system substrate-binding protein
MDSTKVFALILFVVALFATFVTPATSITCTVSEAPQRGGTLVIGMVSEPTVLDSCSGAWTVAPFAGNIFDTLLATDEKMNIVPELAESWRIDYANKRYIFKIRSGVKWHDGKPLTVEDVKFTFEYIIPNYDNRGVYFKGTKVEILNETSVAIIPGNFAPGFQIPMIASADIVIYPKHLLEGVDFLKSEFRTAPIGSGPFKFQEWVKGSHIVLVRNENYWKPGKPYLDKIVFKFITDPAALLAALIAGDVDYVYRGLPYEAYKALTMNPNLQVFVDYKPAYKVFLAFNLNHTDPAKKAILSNVLVRKAIAYAINKTDIVYKATLGVCRPSDRFWSDAFMPPNPNMTTYEYNPKKANELLDQAGFPMVGGKRFTLELLTRSGEADEVKTADLLKNYLKNVGIDIVIKAVDFNTFEQLTANYQYDIQLFKRWIMPIFSYQNHHSSFIIKGRTLVNTAQYSNPKVDYWYDVWAYYAKSDEERVKALLNVESILTNDLPELPIYDVGWMYVWNKRVGNAFVPARNWLQSEKLENIYIITPTVTPPPAEQPTWPYMTVVTVTAAVIVVAAIASVIVIKYRRKSTRT